MVKNTLATLFILCISLSINAQSKSALFSGKISDVNNQPISGASIVVNDELLTITENDGSFKGDIALGTHLITIICFGYETKQIKIEVDKKKQAIYTYDIETGSLKKGLTIQEGFYFQRLVMLEN